MKQNNYLLNLLKVTIFSFLLIATAPVRAEIKVVTTIKPLHSLVANVMDGIGEPGLIIDGSISPHSFTMKPSHAKMLEEADVIFWIGEGIETSMEGPLDSIAKGAEVIEFMELDSIAKLKFREESIFGDHDDHDDHDDHEEHDDHGHAHGEFDAHIWLDPMNAKEMVHEIAHELSHLDPANKDKYESNADATIKTLEDLMNDVSQNINQDAKFVVFHDAYQYFEERFNVNILGAFTVNTDVMPGAEQLAEIREIIEHDKVACVFSEPQFNPDIIKAVAKDMDIKTGVVDPLGATLNPGKDLYFDLIKNMSSSFKNC